MSYGDQDCAMARQAFLESLICGIGSPAAAPMPGSFLEMLEIAAAEHRQGIEPGAAQPIAGEAPLTSPRNHSRMTAHWLGFMKAAVNVAGRFRAGTCTRQLQV